MSLDEVFKQFDKASRLLVTAQLRVAPGTGGRFQPTGFPDLGPALYKGFLLEPRTEKQASTLASVDMLLVESVQSIANRLEEVCLQGENYNEDCKGIPYVQVLDGYKNNAFLTSSVREPHRLASPYVLGAKIDGKTVRDIIKSELRANKERPVHIWSLVPKLFGWDPGCVLHGVFLEEIDGRIRLPRLVSGYIEASSPNQANSGGVYRGEVTAKDNIPYARQEFTSASITASFIVHLGTLNGYSLSVHQKRFLQTWALYKIDRFLNGFLRLRTACEFEVEKVTVTLDGDEARCQQLMNTEKGVHRLATEVIKEEFLAAKKQCFPTQGNATEPKQEGSRQAIYAVDIEGRAALPAQLDETRLKLDEFGGRASVAEVSSGKGNKKTTGKALVLKGEWPEDDQRRLRELHPEKIESEDGEESVNPAHAVVRDALKDWQTKWDKQRQQKDQGSDDSEE